MSLNTPPNKPLVIVKVSQSVDGYIDNVSPCRISSVEDIEAVQHLRKKVDAILVGSNTVINDNPELLIKNSLQQPIRIVVEGSKLIPLESKVFKDGRSRTIIFKNTSQDQTRYPQNVEVRRYLGEKINVQDLCGELFSMGIKILLVEGGSNIIKQFVESKVVDAFRFAFSSAQIKNPLATSLQASNLEDLRLIKPKVQVYGQTAVSWYLMNQRAEKLYGSLFS